MLRTHIDLLNKDLKLTPPLDFNENREVILDLEDTLIKLHEDDTKIWFKTILPPLYLEQREILYTEMMKGNFLGIESGHAALGLTMDEKNPTLCLTISTSETYYNFKEALEDFVNFSSYWKQKIDKLQNENKHPAF